MMCSKHPGECPVDCDSLKEATADIIQPLYSAREERKRIVTWLRRRALKISDVRSSEVWIAAAQQIEDEIDVQETQDLRDVTGYPTKEHAASAIEDWGKFTGLMPSERVFLQSVAKRLRTES